MGQLTNNIADCEILNLETGQNRRGPYAVRQDGVAPRGTSVRSYRFLLRKDGTWVNNLAVFVLPEAEQEAQFTFASVAEVYALVNRLGGTPRAEAALPEDKISIGIARRRGVHDLTRVETNSEREGFETDVKHERR